ncbi:hypothetical protein [Klebsiella aerogenes EA1509E]|nr:hypothetical protein [Klebsiella aerogenes EA1509E]
MKAIIDGLVNSLKYPGASCEATKQLAIINNDVLIYPKRIIINIMKGNRA